MVFDGHSDIWTDVTLRSFNGERDIIRKHHLERLRAGQITGSILVMWIDPPYTSNPEKRMVEIEEAIKLELPYIQDDIVIAHNFADVERALAENKLYFFIGMEGLSGIGENIDLIDHYHEFGARHAGLTWNEQNALATGVAGDKDRGLTALGKQAVKRLNDKKMLVDVSHLNDKSFWDLIDVTDRPVIASHSNSRTLCNAPRNLTDDQIKKIGETGGLVGMNSFNLFVSKDRELQNVHTLAMHAAYVAELIGVDHVAIGMDYCEFLDDSALGSFSTQENPYIKGLEDASHTPNFLAELKNVGFNREEIEKISYKNYHRIIQEIMG